MATPARRQPTCTPTPTEEATEKAVKALEAAGAIMVEDKPTTVTGLPALPAHYEEHATIDDYYKHLGPGAPVKSLVQEVEIDDTDPQEALKFGNKEHAAEAAVEDTPGGPNQLAYDKALPERKKIFHEAIEKMMIEPSGGGGPVIARRRLGARRSAGRGPGDHDSDGLHDAPSGARWRSTSVVAPMTSSTCSASATWSNSRRNCTNRRRTWTRRPTAVPKRCRRSRSQAAVNCNPDYRSVMDDSLHFKAVLPFSLETTSAASLEKMMEAGTLTSKKLVRAELYRIALTNAQGPAIQAVRDLNPDALKEATESDRARRHSKVKLPLEGIPVLVNDSIDVSGLPTSSGSIALQENLPAADATIVAKLKAAGAIVLGDTNTTELGGAMEGANMPQGYSSLGGQVLLPSDTNKTPGGSSAGSAVAVAAGLAPLAVGLETSTEAAQLIAPAANAGVVALKPTVGLISRTGEVPVAPSQDTAGADRPDGEDVATELGVLAGPDPSGPDHGKSAESRPQLHGGSLHHGAER